MLRIIDKIKIKNNTYNYIFCDTYGLLLFLNRYKKYEDSLIEIMKAHRKYNQNIISLILENYRAEQRKVNGAYFLIYNEEDVLGIARVFHKNNGYLSLVHTNKKYRGNKICQNVISNITKLTNKHFNISTFKLEVLKDNISAIKCYEKIGFKIIDKRDKYHVMNYEFNNN